MRMKMKMKMKLKINLMERNKIYIINFKYYSLMDYLVKNYILIFMLNIINIIEGGLGIGDWGLGIGPNPQSPIPNPQLNIKNI